MAATTAAGIARLVNKQFKQDNGDETPAEFITGIITEKGLISLFGVVSVMREMPVSDRVNRVFLNNQTSNR